MHVRVYLQYVNLGRTGVPSQYLNLIIATYISVHPTCSLHEQLSNKDRATSIVWIARTFPEANN